MHLFCFGLPVICIGPRARTHSDVSTVLRLTRVWSAGCMFSLFQNPCVRIVFIRHDLRIQGIIIKNIRMCTHIKYLDIWLFNNTNIDIFPLRKQTHIKLHITCIFPEIATSFVFIMYIFFIFILLFYIFVPLYLFFKADIAYSKIVYHIC